MLSHDLPTNKSLTWPCHSLAVQDSSENARVEIQQWLYLRVEQETIDNDEIEDEFLDDEEAVMIPTTSGLSTHPEIVVHQDTLADSSMAEKGLLADRYAYNHFTLSVLSSYCVKWKLFFIYLLAQSFLWSLCLLTKKLLGRPRPINLNTLSKSELVWRFETEIVIVYMPAFYQTK